MARKHTLNHPAPGHYPTVGRVKIGRSSIGRGSYLYGTTLRCSCGEKLGDGFSGNKVANVAPSKGGRTSAQGHYQAHLEAQHVLWYVVGPDGTELAFAESLDGEVL
jgi:hypothetical protein